MTGGTGLLPKVPQLNKPSSYNSAFKTTSYSNHNPAPSNKYNPHGNTTSSLPQINNSTTGVGAGSHGNSNNSTYLTGLTQHAWSTRHHKAAKVRKLLFPLKHCHCGSRVLGGQLPCLYGGEYSGAVNTRPCQNKPPTYNIWPIF